MIGEVKGLIKVELGLNNTIFHDTYLGLPTVVGRNKRKFFASIKDKVWK